MTRRIALSLLVLLLVAGTCWLGLAGKEDDAGDMLVGVGAHAQPEKEVLLPSHLSAGTERSEETPPRAVDDGDALQVQREEIAPTLAIGGPTLRVVDAATQLPVPFAEVFVADLGDGAQPLDDLARWAIRLERDRARRADGDGHVELPPVRRQLGVVGRAERLFGMAVVRAQDALPVLALLPDYSVRVRVEDASGAPVAGVQVALCADVHERAVRLLQTPSGTDGIAELRHLQLYHTRLPPHGVAAQERQQVEALRERVRTLAARGMLADGAARASLQRDVEAQIERLARAERARGEAQRIQTFLAHTRSVAVPTTTRGGTVSDAQGPLADFLVLAQAPQLQPAHARIAAAAPPADLITLRLLPTTTMTVRVLGPDGLPLRSPCRVLARPAANSYATPPALLTALTELCELEAHKPLGAEQVQLAPVGLGLQFDIHVRLPDNDFDFAQQGVPGPVAAGPFEVVVRTPPWFTTLTGRLVDGDGAPLPGLQAELFLAGSKGRVEGERLALEADGRFELPVRLREAQPPYTMDVQARIGEHRFGKLLALPEIVLGQRLEVGDVVLRELPALAHGVVHDDRGVPVHGARVLAQVLRGAAWTEESFVRDSTAPDGSFKLFGEPRALRLRLRVQAQGHAPLEREINFGDRVELLLLRHGAIRATGFLPPFVSRGAVHAVLALGDGTQPRDVDVRIRSEGRFEVRADGLHPGAYQLTFRVRGLPRPLALAERVAVLPGETVRPPAVDGLDLRARLFQYTVRAVDQGGRALADPGSPLLVTLHDAAGAPQQVPFSWSGNRVELITDQPSVAVVGLAQGMRPARASLLPGDNVLTFVRTHPLHLRLPGLRALLGPEQAARISLVFQGSTGLPDADLQAVDQRSGRTRGYARAALGKSGGAALGGGDDVRVPLMLNGPYEIVLRVDGPGGRVSKTIGHVHAVLDGAQPHEVSVQPDVQAVRDALAELRSRPARR
jgi:hypothetical protein